VDWSICSAVLEGTTTNRKTYNPYYEKSAELYGIPKEAIAPIYQHLDLDVQYQHSDLFKDILGHVPEISAERASVWRGPDAQYLYLSGGASLLQGTDGLRAAPRASERK